MDRVTTTDIDGVGGKGLPASNARRYMTKSSMYVMLDTQELERSLLAMPLAVQIVS